MGQVDKILAGVWLPDRDGHNCRVFIDLSESVHLHYREHRLVFGVDEFLAVAEVFEKGAKVLRERVSSGYVEGTDRPTEILSGSQGKPIKVDEPDISYFNNRMVIEKQRGGVDKIHIHYRDYRLVMNNKETFKKFCECVKKAEKAINNLGW